MRQQLWKDLLWHIARDPVPWRPGRREPRAVTNRPKPFPLLTRPRTFSRIEFVIQNGCTSKESRKIEGSTKRHSAVGHELNRGRVHNVNEALDAESQLRASSCAKAGTQLLEMIEHRPEQRLGHPLSKWRLRPVPQVARPWKCAEFSHYSVSSPHQASLAAPTRVRTPSPQSSATTAQAPLILNFQQRPLGKFV